MVRELTERLFTGDVTELVNHLLRARDTKPGDLARIKELIEALRYDMADCGYDLSWKQVQAKVSTASLQFYGKMLGADTEIRDIAPAILALRQIKSLIARQSELAKPPAAAKAAKVIEE